MSEFFKNICECLYGLCMSVCMWMLNCTCAYEYYFFQPIVHLMNNQKKESTWSAKPPWAICVCIIYAHVCMCVGWMCRGVSEVWVMTVCVFKVPLQMNLVWCFQVVIFKNVIFQEPSAKSLLSISCPYHRAMCVLNWTREGYIVPEI